MPNYIQTIPDTHKTPHRAGKQPSKNKTFVLMDTDYALLSASMILGSNKLERSNVLTRRCFGGEAPQQPAVLGRLSGMGMDPSVARITKDDTVGRVGYRATPGPGQLFMDDIIPTAAPLAVGFSQERLDQRDSLGPIDSRRLLGPFPDHNNPCRPPENQQQSGSDTTR